MPNIIERITPSPLRRLRARLRQAARGTPTVLACFVDELTPFDERLVRALLADQERRR